MISDTLILGLLIYIFCVVTWLVLKLKDDWEEVSAEEYKKYQDWKTQKKGGENNGSV